METIPASLENPVHEPVLLTEPTEHPVPFARVDLDTVVVPGDLPIRPPAGFNPLRAPVLVNLMLGRPCCCEPGRRKQMEGGGAE